MTGATAPSFEISLEGNKAVSAGGELLVHDISLDAVSTPFSEWFKGSKAIDAEGKPLVLFHGTKADFTVFKKINSGEFGPPIYLTDSAREAGEYGEAKGWGGPADTSIMPVFASIKQPYTKGVDAFWAEFGTGGGDAEGVAAARAAGYDGIIAKRADRYYDNETREFVDRGGEITHYIVFDPASVKSATANIGTFDASNPDIRFSFAEEITEVEVPQVSSRGEQEKPSREAAFQRWFGDSKVVDSSGRPLVMYHGTDANFTHFKAGEGDLGMHFGTAAQANRRLKNSETVDSVRVLPVYLSIQNPLRTLDAGDWNNDVYISAVLTEIMMTDDAFTKAYEEAVETVEPSAGFTAVLEAMGYDGIVYANVGEEEFNFEDKAGDDSWIAFRSEQVKSATGNIGTFDASNPDIRFSFAQDPVAASPEGPDDEARTASKRSIWCSALRDGIAGINAKAMAGPGWKDGIKGLLNSGTVKADEVEWSGITEWLQLQEGKVTKDQVLAYLDANGVQVTETILEAGKEKIKYEWDTRHFEFGSLSGDFGTYHIQRGRDKGYELYLNNRLHSDEYRTARSAQVAAEKELPSSTTVDKTKFGNADLVLPGGENYKELLLTLPAEVKWGVYDAEKLVSTHTLRSDAKATADAKGFDYDSIRPNDYKSNHWDQKNILVHIRFNERTTTEPLTAQQRANLAKRAELMPRADELAKKISAASRNLRIAGDIRREELLAELRPQVRAGKMTPAEMTRQLDDVAFAPASAEVAKMTQEREEIMAAMPPEPKPKTSRVLFIEEIQSDWAQDGKKKGFAVLMQAKVEVKKTARGYGLFVDGQITAESVSQERMETNAEAIRQEKRIAKLVPAAPFVDKTDAWVALAIKRMISYAAKNGFDKLAFVNGEQSAERYDLSRPIDAIDHHKRRDGLYHLSLIKDGQTLMDKVVAEFDLEAKVGTEVAAKIINGDGERTSIGEPLRLAGLDLKVGAEGMKVFYDQIVLNIAKDVLRKLGGSQMGTVGVRAPNNGSWGEYIGPEPSASDVRTAGFDAIAKVIETRGIPFGKAAKSALNFVAMEHFGGYLAEAINTTTQPSFDITPAMRKQVSAGLPMFSFRDEETDLGPWRSALRDGIAGINAKAMTGPSWLSQIAGLVAKGVVKAEELKWSQLNEFLDAQAGKVTKEQVLAHLDAHGVKLSETILGGPDADEQRRALEDKRDSSAALVFTGLGATIDGKWVFDDELAYMMIDGEVSVNQLPAEKRDPAAQWVSVYRALQNFTPIASGPTKYGGGNLQQPGGRGYRELLLTLPTTSTEAIDNRIREISFWPRYTNKARKPEDQAELDSLREQWDAINRKPIYKSSHWSQPNTLAHIRFNERADADGRRVLFIEEIQSDWGQDGAKVEKVGSSAGIRRGFKGDGDVHAVRASSLGTGNWEVFDIHTGLAAYGMPYSSKEHAQKKADEANILYESFRPLPGPFVRSTCAWVGLAIKRMVAYAAENGFDKVAFISGDQAVDRFSLKTEVSRIAWSTFWSIGRLVNIEMKGGQKTELLINENGKVVGSQGTNNHFFEDKHISAVVGQEIAASILQSQTGAIQKDGLTVGGEGMRSFYEKIVPNVAKDVLRKLGGGQMESVAIATDPDGILYKQARPEKVAQRDNGAWYIKLADGSERGIFEMKFIAEAALKDSQTMFDAGMPTISQPGFTITPAMRERAAAGLPMFSFRDERAPPLSDGNQGGRFNSRAPFERGQMGYTGGIPKKSNGEAGYGIYAYLSRSAEMRKYYTANGENVVSITPKKTAKIEDLTTLVARKRIVEAARMIAPNGKSTVTLLTVQRHPWAVRAYLNDNPADAYLLPHRGDGVPTGKQLVIVNEDAFDFAASNQNKPTAPNISAPKLSRGETAAFRKWFGDSKMVDAEGEPLVLVHGTFVGNNGDFDGSSPDIRLSFAGRKALTANSNALAAAQARLFSGDDPELVRRQTGWSTGVDGQWRFEINDALARLRLDVNAGTPVSGEMKVRQFERPSFLSLGDLLDHPSLFSAYPQLKSYGVRFLPPSALPGRAALAGDDIWLAEDMGPREVLFCLHHELQHAIQNIEGFAVGGTPTDFDSQKAERARDILNYRRELERFMIVTGLDPKTNADAWLNAENGLVQQYSNMQAMDWLPGADIRDEARRVTYTVGQPARIALERIVRAFGLDHKVTATPALTMYQRLAGEVEARNTQARQHLSDGDRQTTPPSQTSDTSDTSDADAIVIFEGEYPEAFATGPTHVERMTQAITQVMGPHASQDSSSFKVLCYGSRHDPSNSIARDLPRGAQAFHDQANGITGFVPRNIAPGSEIAVLLHEITHKHGKQAMPEASWNKLIEVLRTWEDRPAHTVEAKIFMAASRRAAKHIRDDDVFDEELFAYAVEEAVERGIVPTAMAVADSAEHWLDAVVTSLFEMTSRMTNAKAPALTSQDVVDFAYALAQLERPDHADRVREALWTMYERISGETIPDEIPTAEKPEAFGSV